MTDEKRFEELISEFERVGVDPNTFSAVLAVRQEEAVRILRTLPDGAGPSAFLSRLREDRAGRGEEMVARDNGRA